MSRIILQYTEGYWWRRTSDDLCARTAYLAEGVPASDWEQITDAEKEALDESKEELTDTEALDLITEG